MKNFRLNIGLFLFLIILLIGKTNSILGQEKHRDDWAIQQLKSRDHLINKLPNQYLKSSIFRELYLKEFVQVKDDSFQLNIPFDLHGYDCGAPDCFVTNIIFQFAPFIDIHQKIDYMEYEEGCGIVNKDTLQGSFKIHTNHNQLLFLHDELNIRTFVIVEESDKKINVYYYKNLDLNILNPENAFNVINNPLQENHHPMMNVALRSYEYNTSQ